MGIVGIFFINCLKILEITLDILLVVCYNTDRKEVSDMKVRVRVKRKPTAFEVAKLIIEAVLALAALITAIRWW